MAALARYGVLDTPPEETFDRLARLAARLFRAPIALVSFVDRRRQWSKARAGTDACGETPREHAFCAHAILDRGVFVLSDTARDSRFCNSPLVTGAPAVRFYAGAPLTTPDGHRIGTLCVIDTMPRFDFSADDETALTEIAAMAMSELELRLLRRIAVDVPRDVTMRNCAEAARRDSEAHYRLLADHSSDMIARTGPDRRRRYVSPACRGLLGYEPEELTGHEVAALVHPEDAARVLRRVDGVIRGGGDATELYRVRHRDGHWVWVEAALSRYRTAASGEPEVVSVVRDVTRRIEAESVLRLAKEKAERAEREAAAARARLSLAIETMPEGFALFDPDDRLVLCNNRYREFYPLSDEIGQPGRRFEEILREGARREQYAGVAEPQVEDWVAERLRRHAQPSAEFEQPLSDGRWIRVQERRLADGSSVGIRVDITDLKAREESFRLLFESNPVPMWLVDRGTRRFLEVNGSAVGHYGYSRERFLAMTMMEISVPGEGPPRHRRGDGSVIGVKVVSHDLEFGGRPATLVAAIDVTESRRALERVRLSEERFRDFATTSSDWFWEQDSDLRFRWFSGAASNTGRGLAAYLGRSRWDLIDGGVTDEQWAAHQADLAARRPFRGFRHQRRGADGRVHHISVSGTPVFDPAGAFLGYRGTARDITARVEAEAALRESEARYRLLAEHSSDMIVRTALGGERLYVSPSVRHVLGYEPEELVGQQGFDLVHPDDAEALHEMLAALSPDGSAALLVHRARRKDGSYIWAEFAARRVTGPDGRPEIVGAMRDVTARREAERLLRESEALNRSVVESSADCIKVLDLDGGLLFMNGPGQYAMEIDDFERWRGRPWVGLWPEDARPEIEAALAAARAGGTGRFAALCPTATGVSKWWDVIVTPVLDGTGRPTRLVSMSRDVSARRAVEDALRTAKEEAEAASRTKSQFLANMSHELRTPLNAVIGFSEIIKDAVMGPVDARYREYARDIHRSGQHLLGLIGDVLDLSKIEAGRLELHEEPVDLRSVVAACRRLVIERAREGGVTVAATIASDLPPVRADVLRLKQILLNLLSNAVKFTPAGGRVTVSVSAAGEGVVITVADTGIGMRSEDIPKALEPFRQIDGALNRRFEGTGLGLPLARMLADLHGGVLEVESEPDRGTTARVRLPESRVLRQVA